MHGRAGADDAERTAAFLLERVRAARGRLWDEGAWAEPLGQAPAEAPALAVFATRRVRGVAPVIGRGLLAWSRGDRPVDLLRHAPTASAVLERQAAGRRCVSLLADADARAHGDPLHPDGLSFAMHDLHHLEKFVDPAHHRGQVGFFRCMRRALADDAFAALERTFDGRWRAERDAVIADMNGSAVFLFAVLKMRLNMAVRRSLAVARGVPAPTGGPLDADEQATLAPALATLFEAMGLPGPLRTESLLVSAARAHPPTARHLLTWLESEGTS